MNRRSRALEAVRILAGEYPDAGCQLVYDGDPFRLLIATILSAQTTDEGVNRVTPELWKRFPTVRRLAEADQAEVESIVHPLGFFRNKARSIRAASQYLLESHRGRVPGTMRELVKVPGTGRKTANVVLGEVFGKPAIIVDTHVRRLSSRLDLTRKTDPDAIEKDLRRVIPSASRTDFSHRLGVHGRRVCTARRPGCGGCPLGGICPRRGLS